MIKSNFWKKLGVLTVLTAVVVTGCGKNTPEGNKKSGGDTKWPQKNVTVTVSYKPGGDTDTYARLMSKKLSEKFKQNFVVVNLTGGSGIVAAKTIMAAKPDGYNILFNHTGSSLVQEATGLTKDFSYTDNFDNVATIAQDNSYVVVVKKESGWKNLKDFIAYSKANPGKVRYSQSYGGATYYVGSMLEEKMGIKLNRLDVGSGNSERLAAFMGNQVDSMVANYLNVKDYVEKGDFVVLGVCAAKRSPGMEKIPTFKEQGYDIVCTKNYEIKLPKGTNKAIIEKLSKAIEEISKDPDFKAVLAKYYAEPYFRNVETMNKEDKAEVEVLKKVFVAK